jgi:hypothetical protein
LNPEFARVVCQSFGHHKVKHGSMMRRKAKNVGVGGHA